MAMNKDEVTGKVEQAVGDLTDDRALHHKGERDEAPGKIKGGLRSAEQAAEDLVDKAKDALHRD